MPNFMIIRSWSTSIGGVKLILDTRPVLGHARPIGSTEAADTLTAAPAPASLRNIPDSERSPAIWRQFRADFFRLPAAAWTISLPNSAEPANAALATSGSAARA